MKVGIIGATGYGGVELIRILYLHPNVSSFSVYSSSMEGKKIDESYPHFYGMPLTLQPIDPEKIAKDVDVVFCATPSGVSAKIVPELIEAGVPVIDLSGDFRLKDRTQYKEWYKKDPAPQNYLDKAIYGLTEWVEDDLKGVRFISNPGCFPTATLLGLGPLLKNDLIDVNSIIIDAKTGVSGAGRSLTIKSHFGETNENLAVYKLNHHQHIPEIEQMLRHWNPYVAPITFSTHLVPMTRGIMVTTYAKAKKALTEKQLRAIYKEKYDHHYFVGIRPEGVFPTTKEVYGSNFCDIGVTYDERTGRITVVSVIDNLMKGAAGQAVQNFNLMFGFDEKAGLDFMPIYP